MFWRSESRVSDKKFLINKIRVCGQSPLGHHRWEMKDLGDNGKKSVSHNL